jgi:hypothetical protein
MVRSPASRYRARRSAEGANSLSFSNADEATAVAAVSVSVLGIAGSLKSQYATMLSGRRPSHQSAAPKHCFNDRLSRGLKVMAPIPQSLSGCPMLDGEKLFKGKVSVIGVFTECPEAKGTAVGTSSTKVIALLDGM